MNALKERVQTFADEQRVLRLRECKTMEDQLKRCQGELTQRAAQPVPLKPQKSVWSTVFGSSKAPEAECESVPENSANNTKLQKSSDCVNLNEHSIWACRALSLGCGGHFETLQSCFAQSKDSNECVKEQQDVAKCVSKEATELEQRLKQRAELQKREKFETSNN